MAITDRPNLVFRPYSNIQPFTLRDGATYLMQIEALISWLKNDVIPHLDSEVGELVENWELLANQVIVRMEQAEALIGEAVTETEAFKIAAEAARDAAEMFASQASEIQDQAVTEIFNDTGTQLHAAIVSFFEPYFAELASKLSPLALNTVAQAEEVEVDPNTAFLNVSGYAYAGDNGGATYKRVLLEPEHNGKLQTADGFWWEIVNTTLTIEMFGGAPVPEGFNQTIAPDSVYDVSTAFNKASSTAKVLRRRIEVTNARWAHTKTLNWFTDVEYVGIGVGDNWVPGNTIAAVSSPRAKYADTTGAIFVAVGVFAKTKTIQAVTSNVQNGFGRSIPVEHRPFNNGLDSRIDLWDSTNKNAVGVAPATLKPFSVANYFDGGDLRRFHVRNISFITNCPKPGEGFGFGGYAELTTVPSYADVDFIVYVSSPWRANISINVYGYANVYGMLVNSQTNDYPHRGYAEHNIFDACFIQSGVSVRTPDSWPIIAKTETTLTVRWTPSHTFKPSGTIRAGNTTWDASVFNYTSLTFSPDDGGLLTFTVAEDTSLISVTGTNRSHIWEGAGAGYALTTFRDCEIYDFAHSTLLDPMSPELGSRAKPFTAALEISGYIRAVRFENTTFRPVGAASFLIGFVDDLEFINCWLEPRMGKQQISDSGYRLTGSMIIAGPTTDKLTEVGVRGIGNVHLDSSRNIFHSVNRSPLRPSTGFRFSGITDLVNVIWRDEGEEKHVRDTSDLALRTQFGRLFDFRERGADGADRRVFQTYGTGGVGIGDEPGKGAKMLFSSPTVLPGNILIRSTLLPASGAGLDLGAAANKWGTVYANTGTINTSDERENTQVRELTATEKRVASELRNLIRVYKWNDAVDAKGSDARSHFGVMAQAVVNLFESNGLDAFDYGVVCYDEWEAIPEVRDSNGQLVSEAVEAGNLYGIRYDELMLFIISSL